MLVIANAVRKGNCEWQATHKRNILTGESHHELAPDVQRDMAYVDSMVERWGRMTMVDATNLVLAGTDEDGKFYTGDVMEGDGMIPPWPDSWVEWDAIDALPKNRANIFSRRAMAIGTEPQEDGTHLVALTGPWVMIRSGVACGPMGVMIVTLDDQGALIGHGTEVQLLSSTDHLVGMYPQLVATKQVMRDLMLVSMSIALTAFRFANCRNVELTEVQPNRQQRRYHERNPNDPWLVHHSLEIKPTRKARQGEPTGNHRSTRAHRVRGHFATYTEVAPLFGKLVGRFWIEDHARGDFSLGMVTKDYRYAKP